MSNEAREQADGILSFARTRLGPASESALRDAALQALVFSRIRSGAEMEDAILAEVHRASALDRRVADEFLAFFLEDAHRSGRSLVAANMRRFLDTGDLVHSVLGDVWQDMSSLRFETRAQFISLLAQRLRWK